MLDIIYDWNADDADSDEIQQLWEENSAWAARDRAAQRAVEMDMYPECHYLY